MFECGKCKTLFADELKDARGARLAPGKKVCRFCYVEFRVEEVNGKLESHVKWAVEAFNAVEESIKAHVALLEEKITNSKK